MFLRNCTQSRSLFPPAPPPPNPVPTSTPPSNPTTNRGLGEGFSRAFEFAATPGVFAGIGYGLDRVLGTRPILMIGLTVFAVVGMFIKMWLDYDASMKGHEAAAIAARKQADQRHRTSVTNDFGVDDASELAGVTP